MKTRTKEKCVMVVTSHKSVMLLYGIRPFEGVPQ
jgi:hypothetical protein